MLANPPKPQAGQASEIARMSPGGGRRRAFEVQFERPSCFSTEWLTTAANPGSTSSGFWVNIATACCTVLVVVAIPNEHTAPEATIPLPPHLLLTAMIQRVPTPLRPPLRRQHERQQRQIREERNEDPGGFLPHGQWSPCCWATVGYSGGGGGDGEGPWRENSGRETVATRCRPTESSRTPMACVSAIR